MRMLITGGAGFIGSHLAEALLRQGHEVIALDDFSTGSQENVAALTADRRFRLVKHDVTEPFEFEVDAIFNLACPASPLHHQNNPVKTTITSVMGTLHGLRLAHKRRARFLLASTSDVYGDAAVHPQSESYHGRVNMNGPRACYDEGKRCAESLVMDFHRKLGVSTRIARIFSTYGPRMDIGDGRVVSNFVAQALRGDALTVYGDGSQTRSFCFVSDLVEGLVKLMEHPREVRAVNLGNPQEITIAQLAEEIVRLTQSKSVVAQKPLPPDDPRQRRPDIRRAQEVLGFRPRVPLRLGLKMTIDDIRARLTEQPARAASPAAIEAEPVAAI